MAAEAIGEAACRKNDPADLINIALERLVEGSYELPAFRTLNDMATTIRARVNEEIFELMAARLGPPWRSVAYLRDLLMPHGVLPPSTTPGSAPARGHCVPSATAPR